MKAKGKTDFMKFIKNSDLFDEEETIIDDLEEVKKDDNENKNPYQAPTQESKELSSSTISHDTKIIGNINSQGNLQIDGIIDGDVECFHNLTIQGEIKGNIKASYITIKDANITGDIACEHLCNILGTTIINGNISTESMMLEGNINGNINVQERVILKPSAKLEGDCNAKTLVIEEGAAVKGNINTNI